MTHLREKKGIFLFCTRKWNLFKKNNDEEDHQQAYGGLSSNFSVR
jgi:hypothetical protein